MDADAPELSDPVGEADCELLTETVEVGVCGGVLVPVEVAELEEVPVAVGEGVEVPLSELEHALLADAPAVSEAVGEADCVEEAQVVVLGVGTAVPVPVPVCVMVKLPLGVCVAEGEPLNELEPVLEGEAPGVRGGVAEDERVEEALTVEEGVAAPVPLLVCVERLVGVPVLV